MIKIYISKDKSKTIVVFDKVPWLMVIIAVVVEGRHLNWKA